VLEKLIVKMITVLVQSQQTERPWGVSKHKTDTEISGGMARGGGTCRQSGASDVGSFTVRNLW
jgi:hypothetical protein